MSRRNNNSGDARFGGTDPLDSIADLDKVDELEDLEVTDPSPLPAVPLDPVTGNAAAITEVVMESGGTEDISDAVDADVSISQAAPAITYDADFAALPGDTVPGTTSTDSEEAGTTVLSVARASSLPLALLSLGIALFLRNRRPPSTRPAASTSPINVSPGAAVRATGDALSEAGRKVADVGAPVIHKAGDVAQKAGDVAQSVTSSVGGAASNLGSAAAAKTGQTKDFLGRTLQENPLALGAVVLLLGAAVGLLIPGTRKENELMGETRDNLLDKAQEIVSDVRQTVTSVASTAVQEVRETVTQAASEVKESVSHAAQEVAQDVKATAQEAGDTLKTELTEEAKNHGLVTDMPTPDPSPAAEDAPAPA